MKINSAASGGGKGHFFVTHDDGRYRWGEEECKEGQVFGALAEYCGSGEYIVQPRVRTAPDLADLSPDVLPTLRIVTMRDADRKIEADRVLLKLQGKSEFVDNLIQGGLGAPVDLETGTLGSAVSWTDWWSAHLSDPNTGDAIADRTVPFLPEALDLCRTAHAQIDLPLIGWDVGLSDHGPILVEANRAPSVELMQWPFDEGIGGLDVSAFILRMANGPRSSVSAPGTK